MKNLIALALILATAVQASPLNQRDTEIDLMRRDTEIVYLANCVSLVSCCTPNQYYSEILYYPASGPSNQGQAPTPANICRIPGSGYVTWEGTTRSCRFSSGVTFTSRINGGTHPTNSFSGTGYNGHNWNCYRDNGRTIFSQSGPEHENHCDSVYYCLPQ